ncbi:MAG: hypothetical protein IKL49_00450 [Lachnospiraceae bacterium]|nr:hypothetical protein [Lachnospiraceae bacterium]
MYLNEFFKDADMILVGIGENFQDKFDEIEVADEKNVTILEDYARKKYLDTCPKSDVTEAYEKLAKMLEGKNYFVVTLCTDDKIYHTNIKSDRIVAPCGSYSYLQCEEVCTEDIYLVEEYKDILDKGEEPICPKCGKKLVMNRIGVKKYSEEGYLKKWNTYMKWLQGSLNRNIRVLELGVGMKYPSVIRWPFERVTLINNKAKFMRVHKQLFQLTEDIRDKGISIEENPIDFLRNQIV